MWIIRIALKRPCTFIVPAILILPVERADPRRHLPGHRYPDHRRIWRYTGLPTQMATRIVLAAGRSTRTTVKDVEHTESQPLNGIAEVKSFFRPGTNEDLSYAQIPGVSQTELNSAPPGMTPPFVLAYPVSTFPTIQLIHRDQVPAVVSHYNVHPVLDLYGAAQGVDLGYMASQVQRIVDACVHRRGGCRCDAPGARGDDRACLDHRQGGRRRAARASRARRHRPAGVGHRGHAPAGSRRVRTDPRMQGASC